MYTHIVWVNKAVVFLQWVGTLDLVVVSDTEGPWGTPNYYASFLYLFFYLFVHACILLLSARAAAPSRPRGRTIYTYIELHIYN